MADPQPHRRPGALALVTATVAVVALAAACSSTSSGSSSGTTAAGGTPGTAAAPRSIVVLGDSVAAGEGINDGFTYDTTAPARWTGGTPDPVWDPPYPLCHQSNQAFGNTVAAAFGAKLATFACTGASYTNGITAPRIEDGTGVVMRPAEFGTLASPNPEFVAAQPDVVTITMGANDVSFSTIAVFCATGVGGVDDQQAAQADPAQAGSAANASAVAAETKTQATAPGGPQPQASAARCTQQSPTATVQKLFTDQLPVLTTNYKQLVSDIQAEGRQRGKVPQIVVTTYYDPLPATQSNAATCLDGAVYSPDQLTYLKGLMATLNQTIVDAVGSVPGVRIADLSKVMAGHEWCTADPWAYGPSVLALNVKSKAPIHPTPAGQQSIAKVVQATISRP